MASEVVKLIGEALLPGLRPRRVIYASPVPVGKGLGVVDSVGTQKLGDGTRVIPDNGSTTVSSNDDGSVIAKDDGPTVGMTITRKNASGLPRVSRFGPGGSTVVGIKGEDLRFTHHGTNVPDASDKGNFN